MKRVYIIRHAKSSWKDMSLNDFDRPLNKRGKLNAPQMGKRLKKRDVYPDMILSSPALRAKSTAKKIAKKIGFEKKIIFNEALYHPSVKTIDSLLKDISDENSTVFLFGHNPELNMLAEYYVGFDENIPTCGIVEILFDAKKWSKIEPKKAKFVSFDYPKKLYDIPLDKIQEQI